MFLVTDVLIFASLFSVYAVYRSQVAQGPSAAQVFGLGPVLLETLLLLTSSFTCSLAVYAMRAGNRRALLALLGVTLALGLGFVSLEIHDFASLVAAGYTWSRGSFLSAFFTLVGTHGAHVSFGILWGLAILVQLVRRGIRPITARKLYTFALYWHFLDLVWIFLFTVVFLSTKALGPGVLPGMRM